MIFSSIKRNFILFKALIHRIRFGLKDNYGTPVIYDTKKDVFLITGKIKYFHSFALNIFIISIQKYPEFKIFWNNFNGNYKGRGLTMEPCGTQKPTQKYRVR